MKKPKISIDKYKIAKSLSGDEKATDDIVKFYINPFLAKKISKHCSLDIFRSIDNQSKQLSLQLDGSVAKDNSVFIDPDLSRLKNLQRNYSIAGFAGIVAGYVFSVWLVFTLMNNAKTFTVISGSVFAFLFPGVIAMMILHSIFGNIYLNLSPTIKMFVKYAVKINNEAKKQVEYWMRLTWREFEIEVAKHLNAIGVSSQVTPGSGDKGVDVVAHHKGNKIIIQCKKYSKPINPNFVRELYGTLVSEKADYAFLVSFSGFSPGALSLSNNRIFLMDIDDFMQLDEKIFDSLIKDEHSKHK